MSIVRKQDGKKWINSFVAIISILIGYLAIQFLLQMSEWFDLEAKVSNFAYVSQGVGLVIGLASFLYILKNQKSAGHLNEVYEELLKVVWPNKDAVVKVTVGIVIGVSIVSAIFVGIDFLFQKTLELIY